MGEKVEFFRTWWYLNILISHILSYFSSNWGTEKDEDLTYHNGNSDPRGFGRSLTYYFYFLFLLKSH
jgi:hypothetical protein